MYFLVANLRQFLLKVFQGSQGKMLILIWLYCHFFRRLEEEKKGIGYKNPGSKTLLNTSHKNQCFFKEFFGKCEQRCALSAALAITVLSLSFLKVLQFFNGSCCRIKNVCSRVNLLQNIWYPKYLYLILWFSLSAQSLPAQFTP